MKTLGPYTLTQRLGAGGMGEVWKGQRTSVGGAVKRVAIKILLSGKGDDENARQMFLDEARLSMLLTNSNIVQVFDVAVAEDGSCYMAMEWINGLDLSELGRYLRENDEVLTLELTAFIVGEVLKALAYAHEFEVDDEIKTLVHRDISPHNVMLSRTGEVKLMDFGVARLSSEETSGIHVKGKLRYMPPEQLGGQSRDPRLDLFAVGAVFHELLTGEKFRSYVVEAGHLYGVVLGGQYRPLDEALDIPAELRELLEALLAADPDDRPPSAREAYQKLSAWDGYRDRKFDLQSLVRRIVKAARPTGSEKTLGGTGSATTEQATGAASGLAGSATELAPASDAAERTHTPGPEPRKRSAATFAGLGLSMVGLLVGVGSVGYGLGWWAPESAAPELADVVQPDAVQPEQEAPSAKPIPAKVAAPTGISPPEETPPPTETPPVETPLPTKPPIPTKVPPASTEAPLPTKKPAPTEEPKKAARVPVKFTASDYFYLEVRVGKRGKVHGLEPAVSTSVAVGSHVLYTRENSDSDWRRAKRVTLEAGKSYEIDLLRPTGAKVVAR